jgi:ABC-2 type transport system permease protein
MKSLPIIRRIARYQWQQILSIRQLWLMVLVLPLTISLFIGYIYQQNYLRKLPVVLVDLDNSHTSHTVARYLDVHRFLQIKYNLSSLPQARSYMQSRKADALILIPPHFEQDLKSGTQTTIKAYSYGASLVISRELQKSVSEIVTTLNAKLKFNKLAARQQNWEAEKKAFPPLRLETHNLYNPYYNYQWFVPPAIIIAIWQLLLVLSVAIIWSKDYEQGRWQQMLRLANKRISLLWIGRLIPFLIIFAIQWLVLVYAVFPLFNIPFHSPLWQGLPVWLLFVVLVYHYGSTISILSKDSLFSVTVCSLTLAGAFAFSGYTYPIWEIPLIPRLFAYIMPTTHYLPCFQSFYMEGKSVSGNLTCWSHLLIYAAVMIIITLPAWYFQIKRAKQT